MANEKHLSILNRKGEAWQRLMNTHIDDIPDLSGADLSNCDFSNMRFADVDFRESNLENTNFSHCFIHSCDFSRANLEKAHFNNSEVINSCFRTVDASGADFENSRISYSEFIESKFIGSTFNKSNIEFSLFNLAVFEEAKLINSNIGICHFYRCNLLNTDISKAKIGYLTLCDLDMSCMIGLESVKHRAPSTIGIDTLYESKGRIPESFLINAGVPEDFISRATSIISKKPLFASCFISHSTKDQSFAEKLHADLQKNGVRSWFAPKDIKIGDKIRKSIHESIRENDRLLVILSKNSIASDWVEQEVETAFEEERKRKTEVLFPVRIDSSIMETDEAWAADIRNSRHIGDFIQWEDRLAYLKAFDRLLRDLKGGKS